MTVDKEQKEKNQNPVDSLGDERYEEQEKKRRLKFAAIVVVFVFLGGFLLFFDNILNHFTSGRAKVSGQIDKEGARISKISDTERQATLAKIKKMIDEGKIDEARAQILNLLQKDVSPEAHFLAGTVYLRLGNIKGAYDHLKDATRLKNNYIEAQQKLGEIYVVMGDYEAAAETASLMTKMPDYLSDGLLLESEVALGQGNLDLALQKAKEALSKSPGRASAKQIVYLADIYLRKGDRNNSAKLIKSINQAGLDAEGLLSLVKYYLAAADESRATSYLREALQRYPDNPEVQFTYGRYLFSRRKFPEAILHYQKAMAALPNVQIIAYHLGQSLLAAGEREKAKALIEAMLAKDPNNLLAWRLKTQYHLAGGERRAAIETLNQIKQYIPDASASYALLGELYLQDGVISLAEKNAQKAITLGDKTISPQMVLGDVYFRRGEYDKASGHYEKVLQMQPNNLAALLQAGDAYLNLGQVDRAEANYRRAMTIYPNVSFIQTKLARIKATRGDRAGSLVLARQYFQNHQGDAKAVAEYANALVLNGQLDNALELVSKSIKKRPNDWFLHYVLGDLYLLKRDVNSASQSYSRAAALNPGDVNLAMNLAARYDQAGMIREAEAQYLRAYKGAPQNMPVVNEVAWYFIDTRNSPQQAKEMVELLKNKGEGANEKDTVGWYYFNINDYRNAEYYLREALSLDTGNAIIRGHLALLLAQTKREKEAKAEAQMIISNLPPGKLKDKVGLLVSQAGK
ncbi:MAG: tetratricopeptide repeat protein [Syntrophales bacterium]